MKNDDREELDKLIDAALPGYSSAEPMEGLEGRVLRRVQAAGPARRRAWAFRFALAVPALAGLVAAIAVRMWWPVATPPRPAAPAVATLKPPAAVERAAQTTPGRAMKAKPRHSVRPSPLPKDEQFPTPAPLTPEEHALIAWATSAPTEARQAFADLRARADEPVVIPPIQIRPLQGDGTQ